MQVCKYCLEHDYISNLISPCKCKGTMKYVHRKCLETWNKNTCNICNHAYTFTPNYLQMIYNHINHTHNMYLYVLYIFIWNYLPLSFYHYNKYLCELCIIAQLYYTRYIPNIHTNLRFYVKAIHCLVCYYILIMISTQLYTWIGTILVGLYGFAFMRIHIYMLDQIHIRKQISNYT